MEASYYRLQSEQNLTLAYHLSFSHIPQMRFVPFQHVLILLFFFSFHFLVFNDVSGMLIRFFVVALLKKKIFSLPLGCFLQPFSFLKFVFERLLKSLSSFVQPIRDKSIGLRWNWPLASILSTLPDILKQCRIWPKLNTQNE